MNKKSEKINQQETRIQADDCDIVNIANLNAKFPQSVPVKHYRDDEIGIDFPVELAGYRINFVRNYGDG